MRYIVLFALVLTIVSCNAEQQQAAQLTPAHCHVQNNLPDSQCTSGAVFANITASQACKAGYAQSVRNVPQSEKDEVYAEYGITQHAPGAYEVDHLISLEIGGSNDIKNLWPQSYTGPYNAHMKDTLENFLHDQVCSGKLQLQCAQRAISSDWITAYNEMMNKQQISC
jgi:hypothetical protein